MRISRARYVTLCQQSLVTAAVLAVGLSAAGVKTLDIVPQPGTTAGARGADSGALPRQTLADGLGGRGATPEKSEVDSAPVTPKVREVSVTTPSTPSPKSSARQARPQQAPGSGTAAQASPRTKPRVVETAPEKVTGYATVGVTWKHGVTYSSDALIISVRTENNGAWSAWRLLGHDEEDGPDSDSSEVQSSRGRPGTDALVVGDVDRVQMRATTTDGSVPPDMKLAIIDPGTGKMTKQAPAIDTAKLDAPDNGDKTGANPQASGTTTLEGDGVQDEATLSAMVRPAKPYIYSRAQWGANERMREQTAPKYGTIKTGFIHHTVNANNYTSAQVPSLLRGIYAYHTQSRGWRDIGYNFLVDRFGRIWEGRWGGVRRPVVGAHTLGYNEVSFAMSAIGNYDIAQPPLAVQRAFARLFAWKLAMYNIRANNPKILVKGRYLQAINGHRDVGQTACPGRYLYAKLPWIRARARTLQLNAQKGVVATPAKPTPAPAVFTSPTQAPRAAVAQPSTVSFPKSTNLAGLSYPDLVLKSKTGAITVLPTGGQTGFKGTVTTPGAWGAMNLLAAAGDLTGDGKGDVIARARRTGITRIYKGNGTGHVGVAGVDATTRFRPANLIVGAGDWNGDHKNDLLMRTKTKGWLYVVPGTGNGEFGSPRLLSRDWAGFTSTSVAGDVTGDGRPDIVGVKGGYIYVVPSVAGGALGTPVKRRALGSANDALVAGARDLTGDSIGDVVIHSRTGKLHILTGGANGTLLRLLGPFPGGAGLGRLSAGQMAASAQPDVVGVDSTGKKLVVVLSNGHWNVGTPPASNLQVKDATQVLSVGDWNRDGKGDVITREASGDTLMLRPGTGNGTFGAGVLMSKGWASFTKLSAVGDVTGDKLPDLMGKTATGAMRIFPGNGKTSFLVPILAPASLRTFNQVGPGAFKPASLPGSAFLSSDGSFVPFGRTTGAGDLAGYDWIIGPGDVNGDGMADLVARGSGGLLWLLPGTSTGYGERRFLGAGYAGYSLGG